jgi:hypothetical protein
LFSSNGRFVLAATPVVVVFLVVEWLLVTGAESFSGPLRFLGVIVISMLGGIFPALLLVASRKKGDVAPGVVYRFLGHPLLIGIVYVVYMASLFLHGLVIWEDPVQRTVALAVGVMMLIVTVSLARRGAFAPRLLVELRQEHDEAHPAAFAITVGGRPLMTDVQLDYVDREQQIHAAGGEIPAFSALCQAAFQLPATDARELKVWAHRITAEGNSEGLPAVLRVVAGGEEKEFNLKLSAGQVILPLGALAGCVTITLADSSLEPG